MRYTRPADSLNPVLDLGERDAFRLDLGKGLVSYPRNWPREDLVKSMGFKAYDPPPPPPPPDPTPETTPLTRRQFWDWINGKFGVTEAQITTRINTLAQPNRARALNYVKHETFMDWNDPFCTWVRGQLTSALSVTDAAQRSAWMDVAGERWS